VLGAANEGTTFIRNFEKYSPNDMALYSTRLRSSETVSFRLFVGLTNVTILEAGFSSSYLSPLTFDVRRLCGMLKINVGRV
jgi:hypothetical protein